MVDEETFQAPVALTGPQVNALIGLCKARRRKRSKDYERSHHEGSKWSLDQYTRLIHALESVLDLESSVSRQHYIDTSRYLLKAVVDADAQS